MEQLAEQNEKISFHAEYEEEEEAWSKVTPVGQFDSPNHRSAQKSLHNKSSVRNKNRNLKPTNFSEGECSSEDDDCDVIALSDGKRSNCTETSIVKLGNDDISSMNSGRSSSNFSYLKSYSNNMAKNRGRSPKHNSSVGSRKKNNHVLGGHSSEVMSQGQMIRAQSCSSDDGLNSVSMAGISGDESQSGPRMRN